MIQSVAYWQCLRGHTEPHLPFDDLLKPGPGRAARPCRTCRSVMNLVKQRLTKDGQLDGPFESRPKVKVFVTDENGEPVVKYRRAVSPRATLRRVMRRLPRYEQLGHFRTDKATGIVSVDIALKGDAIPDDQVYDGRYWRRERRHIVLSATPAAPLSISVELVDIHGWLADVKSACKRARIHLFDISTRNADWSKGKKVVVAKQEGKHGRVNRRVGQQQRSRVAT